MSKINSTTLFNFYLKSLNGYYNLPADVLKNFGDTINIASKFTDNSIYGDLVGNFGGFLVPDFEYLFTAGLYFSFLASGNYFFSKDYIEKLYELMKSKNDPLADFIFEKDGNLKINKLVGNYLTPFPTKVFEFLGNNFIGQAAWMAKPDKLPDTLQMIKLFNESKMLHTILQEKTYLDNFTKNSLESFLKNFAHTFSNFPEINNFLESFLKNINFSNDIQFWKNLLNNITNTLATINEFIKPLGLSSAKEVDNIINLLFFLNLSNRDVNQFSLFLQNLRSTNLNFKNTIQDLINDLLTTGYGLETDKNKLIKTISNGLYSNFMGLLTSFLKKAIREGNLNYGDCFYYLKIYSLSSILIDLINSDKMNSLDYTNIKSQLKFLLTSKGIATNMVNLLDSLDKNMVISFLEVLKRIGQKVTPWVIQKSPDMPKDSGFWLRLALWTKIYNSLDKQNPKYTEAKKYMLTKLRNIISSYSDTVNFYMFLNNLIINDTFFDSFMKNLDSLVGTIGGFPMAIKYENPDYLYSQLLKLKFLKNNNQQDMVMKNFMQSELIVKIMTKDNILNKVLLDYNDYKIYLKEEEKLLEEKMIEVLENFYGASLYRL